MWPWEHLALGYVLFGTVIALWSLDDPTATTVGTLAVATQLPDLVDKPLAWGAEILPSGVSLAHSVLVTIPVCLLVYGVARRLDRRTEGIAFVVGYSSHLLGDVVYPVVVSGDVQLGAFFWPLQSVGNPEPSGVGVVIRTTELLQQYGRFVTTPRGIAYLLGEVALVGTALLLWRSHGYPGMVTHARWSPG